MNLTLTKDELNEIYLQRSGENIGGFAWGQDFFTGLQQINNKETFANVRAIRAF